MDFFNRHYQSTLGLLRSMTPAAQVSSVIMLVAIVASMVYLFQYQLSGGATYLFGGQEFSQGEIGVMETALSQAGLNQYEIVGNRLRVPLNLRDKYTKAIADGNAVPRDILPTEASAASSNPFLSSTAQHQMAKSQKIKKLEDMIRQNSKVAKAVVEYDERLEGAPFRETRVTCAVVVNPVGNYQLTRDDVVGIKNVIRSSLAGIKDSDITIQDTNSGQSFTGDMVMLSAAESELIRAKRWWEDDYRKKISTQLAAYQAPWWVWRSSSIRRWAPTLTSARWTHRSRCSRTRSEKPRARKPVGTVERQARGRICPPMRRPMLKRRWPSRDNHPPTSPRSKARRLRAVKSNTGRSWA